MITIQKEFSSLNEAKEEFLMDCKVKNLSESTIKNYDECFSYFITYDMQCQLNNAIIFIYFIIYFYYLQYFRPTSIYKNSPTQ